jgi:hypothetical protein
VLLREGGEHGKKSTLQHKQRIRKHNNHKNRWWVTCMGGVMQRDISSLPFPLMLSKLSFFMGIYSIAVYDSH